MTKYARPPIPYREEPEYPAYAQALTFADDFRAGAPNAYAKDARWAKYLFTPLLRIQATQLQEQIYTVVCYPPGGFEIAEAGEVDLLEYFRGWILQYAPLNEEWFLLAASQEVGIDEFIRLRRAYKEE